MTGAQVVYWRDRIKAANKRGYFTGDDQQDAGGWGTCAVGEQRKKHPTVVLIAHNMRITPADEVLNRLGNQFAEAVTQASENRQSVTWHPLAPDARGILKATKILDLIEARVMELEHELQGPAA